jgi:hypothetical protein
VCQFFENFEAAKYFLPFDVEFAMNPVPLIKSPPPQNLYYFFSKNLKAKGL